MAKNTYKIINKFECCGKTMIIVIMDKAACVMSEKDYSRLIKLDKIKE